MDLRSAPWLASLTLLGGCALLYDYGSYADSGAGGAPTSGGGGTAGRTTTAGAGGRPTSSTTHAGTTSTTGAGGKAGTGGATTTTSTGGTSTTGAGGKGGTGGSSTTGAGGKAGASSTTGAGGHGGATTTTGAGGAVGCAAPTTCVLVPPGWSGPIALGSGAAPNVPCIEPDWPTPAISGGTSIDAPAACTACTCGAPQQGACPTTAAVNKFGTLNCNGAITTDTLSTTCQAFTGYDALEGAATDASSASCSHSQASPTQTAAFSAYAVGCSGGTLVACAGGRCAPPATRTCVYQVGAVPSCPMGYPAQVVLFGSIDDQRGCSACSCAPATGRTCEPTVQVYSSPDCSAGGGGAGGSTLLSTGLLDGSSCAVPGATAGSALITDVGTPAGGFCAPSGGAPTGSATGQSPITVCCSS